MRTARWVLTAWVLCAAACSSTGMPGDGGNGHDVATDSSRVDGAHDSAVTDGGVGDDVLASDTGTTVDVLASDTSADDVSIMDVATSDAPAMDVPATDVTAIDTGVADSGVCTGSGQCGTGRVCEIGACGSTGVCVARMPTPCPPGTVSECGCDGRTYSGSCTRINASIGLAHTGACTTPTDAGTVDAGGSCTGPGQCASGHVCQLGACGSTGTCVPMMSGCTPGIVAECGCNGVTYPGTCDRTNASTGLAHPGACTGPADAGACTVPNTCCQTDADCTRIHGYCVGAANVCSGTATGVCKLHPLSPTQCWRDADCAGGRHCSGQQVCPCNAMCLLPDSPGNCV